MIKMKKKYYIIIAVLSVLLLIIIGLISIKTLKETKNNNTDTQDQQEQIQEKYTGNIRCEREDKNNTDVYMAYFINNIEVKNNNAIAIETKRKLKFNSINDYNGFKENANVISPVYEDENLIVEYVLEEKQEIAARDVDEYVESLAELGYKCEKVMK